MSSILVSARCFTSAQVVAGSSFSDSRSSISSEFLGSADEFRPSYDLFGNLTSEQNLADPTAEPADHLFGFTGRERDEESDLQYNRARYFDAALGQFLSEDPLGFDAGDANLRRYVGNSSTFAVDPSGLEQDYIGPAPDHLNAPTLPYRDDWWEFRDVRASEAAELAAKGHISDSQAYMIESAGGGTAAVFPHGFSEWQWAKFKMKMYEMSPLGPPTRAFAGVVVQEAYVESRFREDGIAGGTKAIASATAPRLADSIALWGGGQYVDSSSASIRKDIDFSALMTALQVMPLAKVGGRTIRLADDGIPWNATRGSGVFQVPTATTARTARIMGHKTGFSVTPSYTQKGIVFSKLDDGIPSTGVPVLEAPAIQSRSFAQKMDAVRRMGYDVVEDASFLSRGEFDVDSMTFTYNPQTMTRLDLVHEWRHYKQLIRLEKRGLNVRQKGIPAMEVGAYRFEQRLWERIGRTPGDEYIGFHSDNLTGYLDDMHTNRRFLFYHKEHAEIFK